MNKPSDTITATFLKAYELGGIANTAIEAVRVLHDLGYNPNKQPLPDKWQKYYTEVLPKQVQEQTEAFDFSQITSGRISPIIAEVENELRGLAGDERERYLFSLLTPFADLAKILHPTAEINRLKAEINSHRKDLAMWESQPQDEQLYKINGEPSGTPKDQAEACKSMIARCEANISRLYDVNRRFCEVLNQATESDTIEYCCGEWVSIATQFANRLDALLLTFGVDLLQLQEKSGIYLKSHRLISDVDYYVGSFELTQYYINALPPRQSATSPGERATAPQLPSELDNERARGYFAKAIEAKLMSKQFEWLASQALLACFARDMSLKLGLNKAKNSDGSNRISWQPFEVLFGLESGRLKQSLNDIQKTGQEPIGIETVNVIFQE